MHECQTCTRTFASWQSCMQHMDALGHWVPQYECDGCYSKFYTRDECNEHMDDYDHHRWECDTCTRNFNSVRAKEQHMDAVGHWEHYCTPCRRRFGSANELKMHMHSRTHQGATVCCPFCKKGFVTASGVSHHLETNSCPKATGVNRESIYQAIRSRDRNGFFTNNLLECPNGENQNTTWDVNRAWNGQGFECYLCHRIFNSIGSLDQHLKSPVHQQELYHCPNKRTCGKRFKSLAHMFNHLESESCGFIKFGKVKQNVEEILTGRQRLIGFST